MQDYAGGIRFQQIVIGKDELPTLRALSKRHRVHLVEGVEAANQDIAKAHQHGTVIVALNGRRENIIKLHEARGSHDNPH